MSLIRDGQVLVPEGLKNAKGGTELMRDRLVSWLGPDALKGFDIHVGRVYSFDPNDGRKQILWVHDLPRDLPANSLNLFDAVVFVSQWQRDMFHVHNSLVLDSSYVIQNTFDFMHSQTSSRSRLSDNTFQVVYHTTPHRGLDIAVAAFQQFHKEHPNSQFDVYSSFKVYGMQEKDEQYRALFDAMDKMPGVTRHEPLENHLMIRRLGEYDCFLYPSTWHETSCLAMMEALAAGLYCIHSNLGALTETSGGLTRPFDYRPNKLEMVKQAYQHLTRAYKSVTNPIVRSHDPNKQSWTFKELNGGPDRFKNSWTAVLNHLKG